MTRPLAMWISLGSSLDDKYDGHTGVFGKTLHAQGMGCDVAWVR